MSSPWPLLVPLVEFLEIEGGRGTQQFMRQDGPSEVVEISMLHGQLEAMDMGIP